MVVVGVVKMAMINASRRQAVQCSHVLLPQDYFPGTGLQCLFLLSVCAQLERKKKPVVLFTLCLQRGVCRVISHTGISSPDEVSYGHDQFTEPSNCRPHVPILLPGTWLSRVSGDDRYSPTTPLWS